MWIRICRRCCSCFAPKDVFTLFHTIVCLRLNCTNWLTVTPIQLTTMNHFMLEVSKYVRVMSNCVFIHVQHLSPLIDKNYTNYQNEWEIRHKFLQSHHVKCKAQFLFSFHRSQPARPKISKSSNFGQWEHSKVRSNKNLRLKISRPSSIVAFSVLHSRLA